MIHFYSISFLLSAWLWVITKKNHKETLIDIRGLNKNNGTDGVTLFTYHICTITGGLQNKTLLSPYTSAYVASTAQNISACHFFLAKWILFSAALDFRE